ncbi:MAG: NUDIX domain-containing protein [Steroidobacteraceae bacterium]|nr:NUDIX domain-containing protein [Steroidobacteraceae bacterium]
MAEIQPIHVMAGALCDGQGRVLIAQRPAGKHLAGGWEFPGGKLDADEDRLAGLRRELAEELGVELVSARPLIKVRHDYPDRSVLLDVWLVDAFTGEPRGLDGQALVWVPVDELPSHDLLPADRPIVTALRLPPLAAAAASREEIERLARGPACAILWRCRSAEDALEARALVREVQASGHRVFIVGRGLEAVMAAEAADAAGTLVAAVDFTPTAGRLAGAFTASGEAALRAAKAGADFIVIAPACGPLSAPALESLCAYANVPLYSAWHAGTANLAAAWQLGAQGLALGPFTAQAH